jgi:DNA-binding transcriptional ArsR family regulator
MASSGDTSTGHAPAAPSHRTTNGGAEPWAGLEPTFVRDAAAQRLRTLAHPDRLRIIEVLSSGPTYVGEIAARLGMSAGCASRHLRALHAARLVDCSQRGNHVLYVLADRDVPRLAALAYRGAATQVRRVIALAPEDQPAPVVVDPSEEEKPAGSTANGRSV